MKSLNLLKELDNITIFNDDFQNRINEAIKELEALNNRSYKGCNHWNKEAFSNNKSDLKGFCMLFGICNGDLSHDMSKDFCCNKWEHK